ncbi:MAG: hypothetical protein ACJA1A_003711 [Saprospiraceae bacterium]|jgi:hypothetical protein|tara:strand:- start:1275 stop:1550 length:276 start_codon:yes stop_codon:yes gene_type:complete
MRIIGEIPHAVYKITVLKMNEKVTIQIEDRLVSQSFVFRDGSGIKDLSTAEQLLSFDFMQKVNARFNSMNKDYVDALEKINEAQFDDFDII